MYVSLNLIISFFFQIQEKLSNGTLGQTNVVVDIHYASSSMRPVSGPLHGFIINFFYSLSLYLCVKRM